MKSRSFEDHAILAGLEPFGSPSVARRQTTGAVALALALAVLAGVAALRTGQDGALVSLPNSINVTAAAASVTPAQPATN